MKPIQNILLVDDDEVSVVLFTFKLREKGFKVNTAADCDEAIRQMNENTPDLLISDIMMPGLSGLDLLSIVKQDRRQKKIPVILISCLDRAKVISTALQMGADAFLQKPFKVERLVEMVMSFRPQAE